MKLRNLGYAIVVAAAAGAVALGTAGTSEAKGKKKMAVAPKPTPICVTPYAPVCGVKGGNKYTYANSCLAGNDGATVVSDKPCPAPKAAKAHKKGGKKKAMKKK
jgi:hypothetical protein